MSKTQKIILGIFTLIPFILVPYIFFEIFNFVMYAVELEASESTTTEIISAILTFIAPIMILSMTTLGLLIFYIVHAAGNKMIESTERIIWIIIFLFFGIIAFPIYWFMRVWNTNA